MSKNSEPTFYKQWWFWTIIVAVIVGAIVIVKVTVFNNAVNNMVSSGIDAINTAINKNTSAYTPGEEFVFDELSLKISPDYSFTKIDNSFSDDNGKTVVVVPITIKNNGSEAKNLNIYSYKGYGAEGVELSKPSAYFMDDAADFGGKLQPGSSYTKNLYFIYDGDGNYKIEFGYLTAEATVSINIVK